MLYNALMRLSNVIMSPNRISVNQNINRHNTTLIGPIPDNIYSYVSKNVKLQPADFLINISSLDIS